LKIAPDFFIWQMNIAHLFFLLWVSPIFASIDSRWAILTNNLLELYDKVGRFDEEFSTKIIEKRSYDSSSNDEVEVHAAYAFKSYLAWYKFLVRDLTTKAMSMQQTRSHLEPKTLKRCNFVLRKMSKAIEDTEEIILHRDRQPLLFRLKIWFNDYRSVLDINRGALYKALELNVPLGIWDDLGTEGLVIPGLY
jgi:hypothetical protein